MKYLPFLLSYLFLFSFVGYSQIITDEEPSYRISFGPELRVTPIYLRQTPFLIIVPASNVQQQPDHHLSGLAVIYTIEKKLKTPIVMAFSQSIRYDLLYQEKPIESGTGIPKRDVKKIMTDFYAGAYKLTYIRNSRLYVGLGLALHDIGSNYRHTQKFSDNNNQVYYTTENKNFIYTSANASIGWRKNKFYTELKMNYIWNNPTNFEEDFLMPEIKCQYQLFSF